MTNHRYGDDFMQYAADSSAYSAAVVTRLLMQRLAVGSVLDVGCAYGTWVRTWMEAGVPDAHGVDGDYVDRSKIEIAQGRFSSRDLNLAFDIGRRFDLVQSLEVGEHIQPASSLDFVASIAAHSSAYVLFSAAPPGQGGEFHINERPFDFWRSLFEKQGFVTVDWLRTQILADTRISYWYRYNTLLYVRREAVASLPADLAACILAPEVPVPDVSPLLFRARKSVIRQLPFRLQHGIAQAKARFLPTSRI